MEDEQRYTVGTLVSLGIYRECQPERDPIFVKDTEYSVAVKLMTPLFCVPPLTMKTVCVLILIACTKALGFQIVPQTRKSTALRMSFLDNIFKPMHGAGTERGHEKEYWDAQQDLLHERRDHYSKKDLKKKYAPKKNWLENMLHPYHGHGSGEDVLDEIYANQQKILYERREYYGNKDMLKKKYRNPEADHHGEIKTIAHDPKKLNEQEDAAMYVDDSASFHFPWEKPNPKLKP